MAAHAMRIFQVLIALAGLALMGGDALASASASPRAQPHTTDDGAPTHSWLLALRLVDGHSKSRLPLFNTSVLVHARLQSSRPTIPASPILLPPSLRSPPCAIDGSCGASSMLPYAQLECVHIWAENWLEWSNIVGIAPIPLVAPAARFAGLQQQQRAQMSATTKRMQLRLMKQSPAYRASDLIWMDMMDFAPSGQLTAAARARGELEWDVQGLAAVLINGPGLPGFKPELETRQLLWPFNPADPVHELDLVIWPRSSLELELNPHPFLPLPSRVSEALGLLERLQNHVHAMQHWWHVIWLLPVCVALALGLLRLSQTIRKSSVMRTAARRCIELGDLAADAKRKSIEWLRDRVGDLRTHWIDNAMVMAHHLSEIAAFLQARAQELGAGLRNSLRRRWDRTREAVVRQILSARDFVRSKVSGFRFPTLPPHFYPGELLDRLFEAGKAADAAAYIALCQPIVEVATDRWQLWTHSAREAVTTKANLLSLRIQLRDLPILSFFDSLSRTVATAIVGALSPSPPAPFIWEGDAAAEEKYREAQDAAEVAAERELFGRPEFELLHGQPVAAAAMPDDDGREHFQDLLSERERMQQQKEAEHKSIKIEEGEAAAAGGALEQKQPEPVVFGWQPLQMGVWSQAAQAYAAVRPTAQIVQRDEEKLTAEEEENREHAQQAPHHQS